jgi:hypothetical protein
LADRPKAFVVTTIPPDLRTALAQRCDLVDRDAAAGWPAQPARGFRVAATTSMAGFDARMLDALPDLEIVICNGAGLDLPHPG